MYILFKVVDEELKEVLIITLEKMERQVSFDIIA